MLTDDELLLARLDQAEQRAREKRNEAMRAANRYHLALVRLRGFNA